MKPYFKSPDNKINRQLPSWRHCVQLTKATVSTACLVRPSHSLIVLTVRFSVHIYSLTFFVLNFHMVITSCTPQKKIPSQWLCIHEKPLTGNSSFTELCIMYKGAFQVTHTLKTNKNNMKQPPPTR